MKATDSISLEKNNQPVGITIVTQASPYTTKVLIGSIPISTYFGNDILTFYDTYKDKQNIDFSIDVDINLKSMDFELLGTERKFHSDGLLITEREIQYTDIIDIYAMIKVPVQYEYSYEVKDYFHLDLNPTPGHSHTVAQNGFHKWIPINTNTEDYAIDSKNNNNTELLVKQIHVYLRPSSIQRVVSQLSMMSSSNIIDGTVLQRTVYHTDEEGWFNPKDYKYDPTMLRLGKVMLQANSTMKDNMTILDTRTRGGGLDESLSKEIIRQINKESLYHWDIGYYDGEAYQENGVMVVKVPRSILKSESNPNGFHESEVQEAVAKHKAYGVLPIIEYYENQMDEKKFNIIPNYEFLNNKHIGYFDPVRSKGDYQLRYMELGSGDNYVLQLTNDAEYGITIPGHRFKSRQYRIDIKAMKDQTASNRSAGTVTVFYKDGTSRQIQLAPINQSQWMVYKENIDINVNIHHVTITLNKTTESRTGRVMIDYVMLTPTSIISEETTEIQEI